MHIHSRREFLVGSAAAGGMLALGPQKLFAQEAAAAKPVDMTIARWTGGKPAAADMKQIAVKLTEKAVAALGGLKRFIRRGDVVWVKPNIGWERTPEQAANTNPDVVATLVRLAFEAGAKTVKVGDHTCNVPAKCYQLSGIGPAVRALGAEVVFMDPKRVRDMNLRGERLKTLPVFPEMVECDLMINVPVVKHHGLSGVTLCMKNYMGVVEKRNSMHQGIATCLADLTRFMKPKICVLDAVRVLTAHGPVGGDLRDVAVTTTVAAGVDIVALDALGAELLGKKAADFATIVKGEKAGLGKMNYRALNLRELAVS
jgi:uncharacterized protein (DUF362 family)